MKQTQLLKYAYTILMVFGMSLPGSSESGKDDDPIKPLVIGQKVPEDFWTKEHLFYSNGDTLRRTLAQYKGKMIVLDFWMSGCMPCLLHQKTIIPYKQHYPNDLAVIMVNSKKTKENYKKIHAFAQSERYRDLQIGGLVSIIEDTYLQSLFSYRSYPSYFWINESAILQTHTFRNLLDPAYVPPFIMSK